MLEYCEIKQEISYFCLKKKKEFLYLNSDPQRLKWRTYFLRIRQGLVTEDFEDVFYHQEYHLINGQDALLQDKSCKIENVRKNGLMYHRIFLVT